MGICALTLGLFHQAKVVALQKECQALFSALNNNRYKNDLAGIYCALTTVNGTENTTVDWTHKHMNMHTICARTHSHKHTHISFLDFEPIVWGGTELIGQIAI